VQDQAAGITDIGEVREQLHAFDQFDTGFEAALDAKGEDRAGAARQVFPGEVVERAVFSPA
jgi:hypothetical protein